MKHVNAYLLPANTFVYKETSIKTFYRQSGKRDSNSRPQPWQGCALPTELFPHYNLFFCEEEETRTPTTQLSLPPQSSASTIPPPLQKNIISYCAQNRTRTCTSLLTLVPETSASTIPPPGLKDFNFNKQERKTRLELATPTLARLCSTN